MRTWFTVTVPKFYAIVTNLLLSSPLKLKWQGMKTVGQLRFEKNISAPNNVDSLYRKEERKKFHFKPLVIPKPLQRDLPYKSKPKHQSKRELNLQRVTVVREPDEQKMYDVIKKVKAVHRERKRKTRDDMIQRSNKHKIDMKTIDKRRTRKERDEKKRIFSAKSRGAPKKN